jgi:hypothetical protein
MKPYRQIFKLSSDVVLKISAKVIKGFDAFIRISAYSVLFKKVRKGEDKQVNVNLIFPSKTSFNYVKILFFMVFANRMCISNKQTMI